MLATVSTRSARKCTLRIERKLGAGLVAAALIVGDEALAAGGDPFHRPPQPPRRPGDDGFLGIVLALVAEAAADVGCDQPDRGLRQAELFGDGAADVVRYLRRAIERQLAGAAIGQHRARLDCGADQPVVGKIEPHHMGRALEGLAHGRVIAPGKTEADVAGSGFVQLRRVLCHRGVAIDDDRQRFITHFQEIGGVLRLRARLRDDGRDRFADMPNRAARQRPARRLGHRLAIGGLDRPKRRHRRRRCRPPSRRR